MAFSCRQPLCRKMINKPPPPPATPSSNHPSSNHPSSNHPSSNHPSSNHPSSNHLCSYTLGTRGVTDPRRCKGNLTPGVFAEA
jgi:hypothetical protein